MVDGDSVITNIFSPRYRVARDLEDQWELMRPGKNRYENWTEEQLQERFGNIEEKMEAMSLESIVQNFQERVERENQVGMDFKVSEDEIASLKSEMENDRIEEEQEGKEDMEEEEWEEKEYFMTKEDFERLKNEDGTITINGERLVIEDIADVDESDIQEEVPFIEIDEKKMNKKKRTSKIRKNNKGKRYFVC